MRALKEHGDLDFLLLSNAYNREAVAAAPTWGPAYRLKAVVEEPPVPVNWLERCLGARQGLFPGWSLAYHRNGGRHLLAPSKEAVRSLKRQIDPEGYDLVVGRYLRTVTVCGLFDAGPPVLLDVDDHQPHLLRQRLPHVDPFTRRTLQRQLRFTEQVWDSLLPASRHQWISLAADRSQAHLGQATLLPNIPFSLDESLPRVLPFPEDGPPRLGVLGTWTYSANAVGLSHFLEAVWPLVRREIPEGRLLVGGKIPSRLYRKWGRVPGVELLGYLADIDVLYRRAWALLTPVPFGGGTNIKTLEAAAKGRGGVATLAGSRGYEDTLCRSGGLHAASTDGEMAAACLRLLGDRDTAREAGQCARSSVESNYNWAVFAQAVAEGLEKGTGVQ
jgi:glycosyltransferase involved in cell wall biosynthesis